jgi:4-alpha-glucanotransferase
LRPFALFVALKMRNHECSWPHWSERKADDPIFENEVRFHQFVQFLFFEQWDRLHAYCTRKGVGLIGDLPIYVAHDSADVWSNPGLFYLDKDGRSSFVAGTPPDYFSKTGQLWGNPLYRWDVHKRTGYKWWRARLQHMLRLFDALRIDHFIGFRRYWKIDARHAEAKSGQWVDGPGADFFEKTLSKTERARIIAEDLGATGPDVEDLRDEFGFPGMRVLQFSFEPNSLSTIRGHCVVYTGTHDNDTTRGWFEKLPDKVKKTVLRDINGKSATISTDLMRTALELPTTLAIFPVQDVLGLGSQARMNRPGTAYGNWSWRLEEGQFAGSVLTELRQLTQKHGRS